MREHVRWGRERVLRKMEGGYSTSKAWRKRQGLDGKVRNCFGLGTQSSFMFSMPCCEVASSPAKGMP